MNLSKIKPVAADLPDCQPMRIAVVILDRREVDFLMRVRGLNFFGAWMRVAMILDLYHPNPEFN